MAIDISQIKHFENLIDTALNPENCDLLIEGNLVNVVTKEIYKAVIGVKKRKIVFIGEKGEIDIEKLKKDKKTKKNKKIIKTENFLLPSFIDSHIHIESSMLTPSEFSKLCVVNGTCCVIADPHEIANVLGIEGIRFMIHDSKNLPMEIYFMLPSCVPAAENLETSEKITIENLKILKGYQQVKGLGELMNFQGVINKNEEILKKIEAFFDDRLIDGHCPGLKGKNLNAYLLFAHSDHESINYEEAIEKLRKGAFLMIREGSSAKNLNIIKDFLKNKISFYNVSFVTDDIHADDLKNGHLNLILRNAVKEGMDEIDAIRCVTLNPARYFNLENLGEISIGKDANITIVDNLKNFNVKKVIFRGKVVAENGKFIFRIKEKKTKKFKLNIMNVKEISENDLKISVNEDKKYKVRVIEAINDQLYTKEKIFELESKDKTLQCDLEKDIIKICVVDRHTGKNLSVGFITGFGIKNGSIAQTIAHDSHNIIAIGADDKSILKAINELKNIGGGIVVVNNEKNEIYSLTLPIAGLMNKNSKHVIEKLEILNEKVKEIGCKISSPFTTLSFMALPVIPELKITDKGIVKNFEFVNLIVE
ncbi:MAG: adenine deaminase [Candidatus Altarchaeaceae archaeon]